ncbi:MAG: prepilin-type N-terminal cleavage/methylation domain-containing protein [Verrucomicrobiae bacterium]|nr:prepilin-type N-terminal cleavage/methylation domain-containing protein [Verrucomicrobiae bacterium]
MINRSISTPPLNRHRYAGAFTLFELMIVVALLSIVVSISLPSFLRAVRKSPLKQAMSDLEEACNRARMMAIMEGRPAELVIRAPDGLLQVRPFTETAPVEDDLPQDRLPAPEPSPAGEQTDLGGLAAVPKPQIGVAPVVFRLPSTVAFRKLVVNLQDMMDTEEARVRFFPNSTCDAFAATLLSEDNEERNITLEITTARTIIEVVR